MLITFKIIIVRTIADTVNNCIEYGIFHYQMQSRDTVTPRCIQTHTIFVVTCRIVFVTRQRPLIWQVVWTDSSSYCVTIRFVIYSQYQGNDTIASIYVRNSFVIGTSTWAFFSIPHKLFTFTNCCERIRSCYTRSNWEYVIGLIFFTTNIGYYQSHCMWCSITIYLSDIPVYTYYISDGFGIVSDVIVADCCSIHSRHLTLCQLRHSAPNLF